MINLLEKTTVKSLLFIKFMFYELMNNTVQKKKTKHATINVLINC